MFNNKSTAVKKYIPGWFFNTGEQRGHILNVCVYIFTIIFNRDQLDKNLEELIVLNFVMFDCNNIGDEYHYRLICLLIREEHTKYINVKFWKRPSAIQLEQLFKQNNYKNVLKL